MTKSMGVITLLSICAIAAAYTDVDDSLIIETVVNNDAMLSEYLDCFLDRTPCSAQKQGYKSHMLEAVGDGCKECNDAERHMLRVFIQATKNKRPQDFEQFKAKFDPNGHIDTTFAAIRKF